MAPAAGVGDALTSCARAGRGPSSCPISAGALRAILGAGGWKGVSLEPVEMPLHVGGAATLDEAVEYSLQIGLRRRARWTERRGRSSRRSRPHSARRSPRSRARAASSWTAPPLSSSRAPEHPRVLSGQRAILIGRCYDDGDDVDAALVEVEISRLPAIFLVALSACAVGYAPPPSGPSCPPPSVAGIPT